MKSMTLVENDASSLRKCYHKLASKLHPDRQVGNPTATRVLAEEVFKLLTIAFQKEMDNLTNPALAV
jgi:DnaJ-class molecular chaperone